GQDVGEAVAGQVGVGRAGPGGVVDELARQGDADAGEDVVVAFTLGLKHDVSRVVHVEGVVAGPAFHMLGTGPASQGVIPGAPIKEIIPRPADQGVVPSQAAQGVVAARAIHDVVVFGAVDIVIAGRPDIVQPAGGQRHGGVVELQELHAGQGVGPV